MSQQEATAEPQQQPAEIFDFKIKFAETKAYAKVQHIHTLKKKHIFLQQQYYALSV